MTRAPVVYLPDVTVPELPGAACVGYKDEFEDACNALGEAYAGWEKYSDTRDRLPEVKRAKAICAECPCVEACLEWAMRSDDRWSVLGGTTPRERKKMKTRNG